MSTPVMRWCADCQEFTPSVMIGGFEYCDPCEAARDEHMDWCEGCEECVCW